MKPKELLTADYLDIVYDQRNKSYGGYELRRHYDQRLRKAAMLTLTGVAAMMSFSFVSSHRDKMPEVKPHTTVFELTKIEPSVHPLMPKPKVIPPPAAAAPKPIKTAAFSTPVIAPDPDVKPDDMMKPNKDLVNAKPGLTNSTGDSVEAGIEPVRSGSGGPGGTGVVINTKSTEPVRYVEQMPQFIGDMNDYISRHIIYPEVARDNRIEGKVVVEFVVNEDGSVDQVKIVKSAGGSLDQEAMRIVSGMPKWKPGKQNGVAVKVYCRLPVAFRLE